MTMGKETPTALREEGLDYFRESRSFALSIVSILPLVVAYHWGIIRSGYAERNMAEVWLVGPLRLVGLEAAHVLNVMLVLAFVAVILRSARSRSFSLVATVGIVAEAAFYATLLFKAGPALAGLLDERASRVFFALSLRPYGPVLLALGAGVYEELLFRLLLVGGGTWLLSRLFMWSKPVSMLVALVVSSLLFAAAHHLGPLGEPLESYSFVFRTTCGLVLGALFLARGLGVAVWTHAVYNALVMVEQARAGM
jgi:hypothetical protein